MPDRNHWNSSYIVHHPDRYRQFNVIILLSPVSLHFPLYDLLTTIKISQHICIESFLPHINFHHSVCTFPCNISRSMISYLLSPSISHLSSSTSSLSSLYSISSHVHHLPKITKSSSSVFYSLLRYFLAIAAPYIYF